MVADTSCSITRLLSDGKNNHQEVMGELFTLVYHELRRIANKQLKNNWFNRTICTTALVNEAYIKLVNHSDNVPENRAHFFAVAATAMRQILINYAEHKYTLKRGRGWRQITYDDSALRMETDFETLLAVDCALDELKLLDNDLAKLVELRFFAGMTVTELAQVFGVTERTVRRNWKKAKALLSCALYE